MKSYLILLPILILAIIQGSFLSLNLVLLVTLFWASIKPSREGFLIAFLAGLLLDLSQGTPLGVSSFYLLVASSILIAYSRKFDPHHPFFITLFVFLMAGLWSLVTAHFFNWRQALVLALIALLVRITLKIFAIEPEQKGRLKI